MFKWFGKVNLAPYTRVAEFAAHLKDGRLMASRCRACGARSFPPRADCEACMGRAFDLIEISGRGTLHTFTRIVAAPTGFEAYAPYTVGVVDLEEGGRALAWFGDTIAYDGIRIGMPLQVVPRLDEEREEIRVYYSLERPGTTWSKRGVEGAAAPRVAGAKGVTVPMPARRAAAARPKRATGAPRTKSAVKRAAGVARAPKAAKRAGRGGKRRGR